MSTRAACDPPRLWVPGVLYVSPAGQLSWGAEVGYADEGEAFRTAGCGRWDRLEDWNHSVWLVERSALNDALVAEQAIILPETLIDRDRLPHAHRWLREQPLLCVSGLKEKRLRGAGLRVWRVAMEATGDQILVVSAAEQVELRAPCAALRTAEATAQALDQDDPLLVDRLLRQLSGGVLTERGVVQALQARSLLEDGYGYHGAPAGSFRPVEQIEQDAERLDGLFAMVFERAEAHQSLAQAVRQALPRSRVDLDEIEIPVYGGARRIAAPRLSYDLRDSPVSLELAGKPQTEWVVEATDRWWVSGFAAFTPSVPSERGRTSRPSGGSSGLKLLGVLVLLVAMAALFVLAWVAR